MKNLILCLTLVLTSLTGLAQSKLDTLYYSKDGYGAKHKEFADYYRVAMYPDEGNSVGRYRDFHINGQIMSDGEFISIDRDDDRNSRFIGTIIVYDKKGNISAVRNYKDGLLDGLAEEYLEDGTIIQEEFSAGKPSMEYYTKYDKDGNLVKIKYSDHSVIWDSPLESEIQEEEYEGNKWNFYSKNGVTVALNTNTIRDYGKYHVLNITISNNSLIPIEFEPSSNITAESVNFKKNERKSLKVYSCEEYIQKYDRRKAWGAAVLGVSEILAIVDSGTSEQKSVSVNSKGEKTVTYTKTYNPFDNYLAWELAHMHSKNYNNDTIEGREIRRVGYFKQSTINPGESVSGYAYVERIKGNEITVNIDVEGAIYTFKWNYRK